MRKSAAVMVLVFIFSSSQGQTFNEWFRQKKTQIEYLFTQIAGLQIYIEAAQKGYNIVDQGLTTIHNIKNGDFNLHNDFFGALKNVNPKISNSAVAADIIALQIKIIQTQKKAMAKVRSSGQFSEAELEYIAKVYFRLLEQTADNTRELTAILTANHYELSDDERIKRISGLHTDMQDKCRFVQWFSDRNDLLGGSRKKEQQDVIVNQSLILDKK